MNSFAVDAHMKNQHLLPDQSHSIEDNQCSCVALAEQKDIAIRNLNDYERLRTTLNQMYEAHRNISFHSRDMKPGHCPECDAFRAAYISGFVGAEGD